MHVRPLAFPAPTDRPRLWGRLAIELRDAMPALAATLLGIGLFGYGWAGRDSLRPPEPPPPAAAAAVEPPKAEPAEPIHKAERQLAKIAPRAARRAVIEATAVARTPAPEPFAEPAAPPVAAPPPPPARTPAPPAIASAPEPAAPTKAAPEKPAAPEPASPEPAPPKPAPPKPAPAPRVAEAPKPVAPAEPSAKPRPTPPPPAATPAPAPEKRVDRKKRPTPMTPQDATRFLALAWEQVTGEPASIQIVSVLWAQWALETGRGRWMVDYNYAGLKGRAPDGGLSHWWTWEETEDGARRVRARFRSYATPLEGALDYVSLIVDRYPRAAAAAREGNAFSFVLELDHGGFFTERPKHYVASVVSLAAEFRREHRAARF